MSGTCSASAAIRLYSSSSSSSRGESHGRAVRVSEREHRVVLELDDGLVARLDVSALADRLLDPGRIVVSGHHEAAQAGALEALVGERRSSSSNVATMTDSNHSSRSASGRPAMRATSSAVVRYGYMPLPRMRRSSASSSAAVVGPLVAAEELRRPDVAVLDDRDHHLAGDVAPHDEHPRLVVLGRIQELLPQHLGAVDVGGVVEAEGGIAALRRLAPEKPHAAIPVGSRGS